MQLTLFIASLAFVGAVACGGTGEEAGDDDTATGALEQGAAGSVQTNSCGAELPQNGSALRKAILNPLRPLAAQGMKKRESDIRFVPTAVRVKSNFAFVSAEIRVVDPKDPRGSRPLTTAEIRAAIGEEEMSMFDGPRLDAVLQKAGTSWKVLQHSIGSTDVSYADADTKFGVPRDLLFCPTEE